MMNNNSYFKLSIIEYFLVISLVKKRVENEVTLLNKLYNENKDKKITGVSLTDISRYTQFRVSRDGLESIKTEIAQKEEWVNNWVNNEHNKLAGLDSEQTEALKDKDCKELLLMCAADKNPLKSFLILQEAIMVPLYYIDDKQVLRERFEKQNIEKISFLLTNSTKPGKEILARRDKNLNSLTGGWRAPVKIAVVSITIILPFSAIALPAVLKALQVLIGYKEANVKAEGVANLGTGALAVKDAETGETGILIAGGLLFGTLHSDVAFSYFDILTKEALLFICVKTLNFLQMLTQNKQYDVYENVVTHFVQTKYELEKHLATEPTEKDNMKEMLSKINIMQKSFIKCVDSRNKENGRNG